MFVRRNLDSQAICHNIREHTLEEPYECDHMMCKNILLKMNTPNNSIAKNVMKSFLIQRN